MSTLTIETFDRESVGVEARTSAVAYFRVHEKIG